MNYLTGCFERSPDLKVRPIPELDVCLVCIPRPPQLLRLNMAAWLVLELCDGLDLDRLVDSYREVAGDRVTTAEVLDQVTQGLKMLRQAGLISASESIS